MDIVRIALEQLHAHPDNANVMSAEYLAKLAGHIESSGHYEPLVVRPHPREQNCYELINGHHRKMVLEQLGHSHADCLVWEVSDGEALMLLASVNRLVGRDDPRKRAALLDKLTRRYGREHLPTRLPETAAKLQQLLALTRPATPIRPEALASRPVPMSFFVTAAQQQLIEQALKQVRRQAGGDDPQQKMSRGDLLAVMADAYVKAHEAKID